MIKINIANEKIKEIKRKHWKWFSLHFEKLLIDLYKGVSNKEEKIINKIFTNDENTKIEKSNYENYLKPMIIDAKYEKMNKIIEEMEFKLSYLKYIDELKEILSNVSKVFTMKTVSNTEDKLKAIKNILNNDLSTKVNDLLKKNTLKDKKEVAGEIKEKLKEYYKNDKILQIIKNVFDYSKFSKTEEIAIEKDINGNSVFWGRHSLMLEMGTQVCPYCNRQYITLYRENGNGKTTADLDHYYIQAKYPYLALSLYNFIPSCQICNSRFKLERDFYDNKVIYPYEEEFGDDAKFSIKLTNDKENEKDKLEEKSIKEYDSDVFYGNSDNFFIHFNINPNSIKVEKINNSITTFKLRKVYQYHKDYVKDLIRKSIIYNESRIDELYKEYEGTLFNSREDVVQMIVSNYIENANLDKRVLAKLTKDICEELGIGYSV